MKRKTKTVLKIAWRFFDHIAAAIYALLLGAFFIYVVPSSIPIYKEYLKGAWKVFCSFGIWVIILIAIPVCFHFLKEKINNWADK